MPNSLGFAGDSQAQPSLGLTPFLISTDTYITPFYTCSCYSWSFTMLEEEEGSSLNGGGVKNIGHHVVDPNPHLWMGKLRPKEDKRFSQEHQN